MASKTVPVVAPSAASLAHVAQALARVAQARSALGIWRLALPIDAETLDVKSAGVPQLSLITIAEELGEAIELDDEIDFTVRSAHSIVDALESALWRVCSHEAETIPIVWCRETAELAERLLDEVIGGQAAAPAPAPATTTTQQCTRPRRGAAGEAAG